ncbi:MAG: bifunctional phosphoribosyl-AMP cyclohydrolase/phosphoribosyl-ATP diphosphatase HisIE [Methylocystaceae bacterium]
MTITNEIKFDALGLVPVIVQETGSGTVLMLAYMNREALEKTMESGEAWYYSRSRQQLWHKGETSGNVQQVQEIRYDCDADALLMIVEQIGPACHTGHHSCFYRDASGQEVSPVEQDLTSTYSGMVGPGIIHELYQVILDRREMMPEGSYTTYLFTKGLDKICKKVGEEAAEVIIGAKNQDKDEVIYEVSDLIYHLMVLGVQAGVAPEDIYAQLKSRR